MADDLKTLPPDLPAPEDDGAATHLLHRPLPSVGLRGSDGETVELGEIESPLVLYCFPMMARDPGELPSSWNTTAGARGCTVQSLSYSDRLEALRAAGATVYGVSLETPAQQQDAVQRLGLGHALLSDSECKLTEALELPTFTVEGRTYLRRLTLGTLDGTIGRVWYPVFPPGAEISSVIAWLEANGGPSSGDGG